MFDPNIPMTSEDAVEMLRRLVTQIKTEIVSLQGQALMHALLDEPAPERVSTETALLHRLVDAATG